MATVTKTTTTMTILMTSHHDLFHGLTMTFYTLSYGPLQVDRVALWNRRFGPADLLNHWKQDFDPTGEPDLAAYWKFNDCLLYTSPSPRDISGSRMPSSA